MVAVQGEPLQLGKAWAGAGSGHSVYKHQTQNKVMIKQCFVELEIHRGTQCVSDNCIIYGIGTLRDLEKVKPL